MKPGMTSMHRTACAWLLSIWLLLPASSHSATIYWKTATNASWTSSSWSTVAGGPYTSAYTSGSDVVFEANGGTTLTITGATTNFASITANENVTLTAGGTLGTGGAVATIDVASGKTLNFAGQTIDTTAGFTKNGLGTWSLTGSAYTGGLTLNAGTILAGGTSALGAGALTINGGKIASTSTTARDFSGKFTAITIGGDFALGDATNTGTLTFNAATSLGTSTRIITANSAVVWAGAISGTGAGINKQGTGTLTLSGTNTYTGATTITAGTLQIGSGSTSGSLSTSSTITNNGTLTFNRSDTLTQGTNFAAGITGTGGVTQAGTGITVLSGTNSYTGTTTVSAGLLRLDSTGALPGGIATTGGTSALLLNGGIIGLTSDFTRAIGSTTPTSIQVGWATSASGGFAAFGGDRTVNFGGAGATVTWSSSNGSLNAGLILSHSTADGTITIANPIAFNGATRTITVNDGSPAVDAILSGALSGTGSALIKTGAGTLALTGTSTAFGSAITSGTTFITISAGTLQLGNGGTAGSLTSAGSGDIQDDSIFAIKSSSNITLQYIIKGSGVVNQIGTGITTLSGGNNYTGGTNISSGTLTFLNVSARPGSGITTVASGATLGLGLAFSGGFSAADIDSLFAGTMSGVTNSATSNVGIDTTAGDAIYASSVPATTRGLTKLGSNTLTLTGSNAYTGPTTISVGTLSASTSANLGDPASNLVFDGGTLQVTGATFTSVSSLGHAVTFNSGKTVGFDTATTFTVDQVLNQGTGGFLKAGLGTVILNQTNTYTGVTTISAGTLQVGTGGTSGSFDTTSSIVDNATLTVNRSDTMLISVVISGSGALNQIGSGTLILSATNGYTGATTINAGSTLQLGNGAGGSSTGNIADTSGVLNNGTLVFNRTGSPLFSTVISGSGDVKLIGTGTIILNMTNTYTGVTTISSGTLQLGSGTGGGSVGNISSSSSVVNNSVLTFNRNTASSPLISTPISGTGAVNQIGSGTVILTDSNTYTGLTTISAGTLQVGNGGTVGTLSGTSGIVNNSVLAFSRSNALAITAPISGSGAVNQIGTGTTTLSGTNSYTGATTISAGALSVSVTANLGGAASSLVFDGGTLQLTGATLTSISGLGHAVTFNAGKTVGFDIANAATTFTVDQVLNQSTGGFLKLGAGTVVLNQTNTYTGTTTVSAGVLRLDTAAALPGGIAATGGTSALLINGGVIGLTSDFTRNIATSSTPAATDVGWADNAIGGFAAFGGDRTVNFGGASASVTWNPTSGRFGAGLVLSDATADGTITIANPIALNSGARTIIVNNGTPVVDAIMSGVLSGTGSSIIKTGTGTLALTAANAFGSATVTGTTFVTISAGTLQIGNGGTSGSLSTGTGDIQNDAVLAFNRSDSLTMQYVIKGTGAVNQIGAGTTTLTGANTYTGTTTITAGTLRIGSGGTTGSLSSSSAIVDNGTLAFNRSNTLTQGVDFAASITGTGGVTQSGTGTTVLSGTNSYTGFTIAGGGVLLLGSATAIPGGITAGGTGASYILFDNGGIIGLTAASGDFTRAIDTATAPTTTVSGSFVRWGISGGETGGFAAFGGDRLVNFGGNAATINWSSGNGVFGAGLTLSHSTSDSTITVVNPINLSNANSLRTITVNDGSAIVDAVMAGALSSQTTSGNGTRFVKSGAGTLALTAANTYVSGNTNPGTTITAGTLQLGNGGTTGSLSYIPTNTSPTNTAGFNSDVSISSGAIFAFNRSDSGLAVANVITGGGSVSQLGTGTTTLSGVNTYTGGTTVTRGTLLITNATGSGTGTGSVTVAAGATLGGTGIISPDTTNSVLIAGTVAPGVAGVGTLTFTPVDGNVTLQSGSAITFQLSANHTNDKLVFSATGVGTLDLSAMTPGSMSVTFAGGYTPALNDSFDLLDWTSVTGLSDTLLNLSTSGFDPSWSWDTSQFATSGLITIIGAVPEPSRFLLAACGFISIILRRRRSK